VDEYSQNVFNNVELPIQATPDEFAASINAGAVETIFPEVVHDWHHDLFRLLPLRDSFKYWATTCADV